MSGERSVLHQSDALMETATLPGMVTVSPGPHALPTPDRRRTVTMPAASISPSQKPSFLRQRAFAFDRPKSRESSRKIYTFSCATSGSARLLLLRVSIRAVTTIHLLKYRNHITPVRRANLRLVVVLLAPGGTIRVCTIISGRMCCMT
jgi:hypothetical protein